MPTPYFKLNPSQRYRLRDAARAGIMLSVRCYLCNSPGVVFYAADLVKVLDPERDTYAAPFPCPRCKTGEYVAVKIRTPYDEDIGKLAVRRLVAVRKTPIWKNQVFDD